jgi:hypothetical protein
MTSGGARSQSGPTPDPSALRRDRRTDQVTWRVLPAEGRGGDPPIWPLSRATAREKQLWAEEWQRPQAIVWEELGVQREVALFVRTLRRAESPKAPAQLTTLVRQFMDALGISVDGMLRKRWQIADAATTTVQSTRNDDPDRASAKARFRSIPGGIAEAS